MEFLLNDLSIHEQFENPKTFLDALETIMAARQSIQKRGLRLRCRNFHDARVTGVTTVLQALQSLSDRNKRSSILSWMTKHGPFWEGERLHTGDDWFEAGGRIVTDTAIGEAAMHLLHGAPRSLVSFAPSDWERTPVAVDRVQDDGSRTTVSVPNAWTQAQVDEALQAAERPLQSWSDLVRWAGIECPRLTLTAQVISALDGWPFIPGVAERFQVLLSTLDRLKQCVGQDDHLNAEGLALHQNHFVGDKAWFTDSSDGEKSKFRNELTFPHPDRPGEMLFCPWHGKVKTPQMRVHFSYPIEHDKPLYIVYIGPKITKR
jgi:hypothetical protein